MEEKNELNDIILNKGGSGAKSKKLLLAISALTLILIIVLVIMNSLKTESDQKPPHAAIPPEPTAPTEIIDDPLFEPVEVIQEGSNTTGDEDLGKIAQKIKQESFDTSAAAEPAPAPAQVAPTPAAVPAKTVQPAPVVKAEPKAAQPAPVKTEPKPAVTPAVTPAPKAPVPVVNTPTIKTVKPAEPKPVTTPTAKPATESPKPAAKPAEATTKPSAESGEGVYYIQVGSFSKEPNQALFDRINASGMKHSNVKSGEVTKVLIGPFQGKKAASDAIGTVRKNIEANAFIIKG